MKKERRDWVTQYKETHNKKIPDSLADFYARFNVETEPDKVDDEDDRAKKKKDKKKDGKKKNNKKGGGDDDDDGKKTIKVGISETIQKFDEFYMDYADVWANKDETNNPLQK